MSEMTNYWVKPDPIKPGFYAVVRFIDGELGRGVGSWNGLWWIYDNNPRTEIKLCSKYPFASEHEAIQWAFGCYSPTA